MGSIPHIVILQKKFVTGGSKGTFVKSPSNPKIEERLSIIYTCFFFILRQFRDRLSQSHLIYIASRKREYEDTEISNGRDVSHLHFPATSLPKGGLYCTLCETFYFLKEFRPFKNHKHSAT